MDAPRQPGRVQLRVHREGTQVEVLTADGQVLHTEGVGSPTTTVERRGRVECMALLPADGADQLARVLLNAASRARQAGG